MIRALVIVCALAGTAAAADREWTVAVPQGWVETPNPGIEAKLTQMRAIKMTLAADATVYLAPDGATQLTMLQWIVQVESGHDTEHNLQEMNRGVMEGAREGATRRVSDEVHFVGPQLVADQVDEMNAIRVHQHRIFALSAGDHVHMVTAMCAGATANAACESAILGLKLTVANQMTPLPGEGGGKRGDDRGDAYRAGRITGMVLVPVVLFVWLVVYLRRKSKKP